MTQNKQNECSLKSKITIFISLIVMITSSVIQIPNSALADEKKDVDFAVGVRFMNACVKAFKEFNNKTVDIDDTLENLRVIKSDFEVRYNYGSWLISHSDKKPVNISFYKGKGPSTCNVHNMNLFYNKIKPEVSLDFDKMVFKEGEFSVPRDDFVKRAQNVINTAISQSKVDYKKVEIPPDQQINDNPTIYTAADAEAAKNNDDGDNTENSNEEDPCNTSFMGFGWLLCPAASLLGSAITSMLDWISSSMEWSFFTDKDGGTAIKDRWEQFLPIANIAFAIVFLFLIYSMATSTGLSNYNVKQILPKLIVAAVAVNISFYLCAAAVDASNIVARGMYEILRDGKEMALNTSSLFADAGLIVVMVVGFIAFGGSALLAILIIVAAITLRQIAIALLVVISPVAFVCIMLPNTKKYFDKWKDYFVKLLMVYPMFMAVWGGAIMVSSMFGTASGSADIKTPVPKMLVDLICMIGPAVAIIPLFKSTGSIMGAATGWAHKQAKDRGFNKAMNAKSRAVGRAGANASKRAAIAAGNTGVGLKARNGATNIRSKLPNAVGGVDADVAAKKIDARTMSVAENKADKLSTEQLKSIATNGGKYVNSKGEEVTADPHLQRVAMGRVAGSLSHEETQKMLSSANGVARDMAAHGNVAGAQMYMQSAVGAFQQTSLGQSAVGQSADMREFTSNLVSNAGSNNFDGEFNKSVVGGLSTMSTTGQMNTYTENGTENYFNNHIAQAYNSGDERTMILAESATSRIADNGKTISTMDDVSTSMKDFHSRLGIGSHDAKISKMIR